MRKTKAAPVVQASNQNRELVEAIRVLCKEKDLSEEMLFTTVEDALKKAYAKNCTKGDEPSANNISAVIDRTTGEIHVYIRRLIVEEVEKPVDQISIEEARKIKDTYQMGDIVEEDVTPRNFLRVAAQTAKGVIMQRLREAERGRVYEEYADKENEILTAVVRRVDDKGALVELMGRDDGYLEADQMIPGENIDIDDHLKVYVLEVHRGDDTSNRHGPQVRVSRTHPNLVKRLFEMEVPEIAGGKVLIKGLAREAGSRTKMAVHSTDVLIDPVGACVGPRGDRVTRVVNELRGEKIDIIKWSENPAEFIANALNPANVREVYTEESGQHSCIVVVPDNQLSLAIGKEGQNARLAAKLTGWKIDIKSQSQYAEQVTAAMPQAEEAPAEPQFAPYQAIDEMIDIQMDEDDTL